jgi:hypothetical protein
VVCNVVVCKENIIVLAFEQALNDGTVKFSAHAKRTQFR